MYERFYNLNDEPFRLSPDTRYSVRHSSYAKAADYLQYGLERGEGLVVVTGAPGMGKTTLVGELLDGYSDNRLVVGRLAVADLETDDLYRMVAYAFGLAVEDMDRASVLRTLELYFTEQAEHDRRTLLVVDEAQELSARGLDDVRLLTNLQKGHRPLLQVFLLGQERLRELVQSPDLAQLRQRIIAAWHLESLTAGETRGYIEQRLSDAGWEGDPSIDERAFELIHRAARGVPREINQICSRLLLYGGAEEKHALGEADVREVIQDLRKEGLLNEVEGEDSASVPRRRAQGPRPVSIASPPASASPSSTTAHASSAEAKSAQPQRAPARPRAEAEAEQPKQAQDTGRVTPFIAPTARSTAASPEGVRAAPKPRQHREADPADEPPRLYADSRRDEPAHERPHEANGGSLLKRRPLSLLALALAVVLVSGYAASPFIEARFGIDVAGWVDNQVSALVTPIVGPRDSDAPDAEDGPPQN